MSYSNCNQTKVDSITLNGFISPDLSYLLGNSCWQNMNSRSPSFESKECPVRDKLTAFCFAYSYTYTNYLTNSLLGYYYITHGCNYISPPYNDMSLYSEYYNFTRYYNWSSWFSGASFPINITSKSFLCNTSNCNSQAFGACITPELVHDISSSMDPAELTQLGDLNYLPVYQSCSSSESSSSSSSSLPTSKFTITLGLKVNQVFISDYNNLNSAASLSFIQNFTNFVNIHILTIYYQNLINCF
jgi:hypothetical protein